jgi:hypothetical protein
MRQPRSKPKADLLELLDADPELLHESSMLEARRRARSLAPPRSSKTTAEGDVLSAGRPLLVPVDRLSEDPNNPRTEFPDAEHGFGRDVAELLLAHSDKNATVAAYSHTALAVERTRALQFVADRVDALAAAANVLQLRAA